MASVLLGGYLLAQHDLGHETGRDSGVPEGT